MRVLLSVRLFVEMGTELWDMKRAMMGIQSMEMGVLRLVPLLNLDGLVQKHK